ncbi:MAG: hypothetical protein A2513_09440 [Sulfurimonas sp. RIFOXYD12_FULL_33_39]|uniref:hypothetical protein n=1 Tax=unclassified Sulfurimonas TaxID=2623549 RepID=UPI0008BEB0E4|nr:MULTISPECIES: hypothetical protein [unclassified Sulfurimonas]OHE05767.1 MAG: hypothetical protein A3G74_06450 [Sulfurimonas sp. RIFCSPLOWO2_12_FULL_34_6]OHE10676.1 MAG: hypothetical protein A2513_09440 [Sulfurimonas sp. RIFOXYD12_FULL_33_39]OHE13189.1 MAG: hypothetical protein A2530_11030 [Sulfurimonas sp. RIFOXYD2_FULL_34_21]DAB27469.1 MAG TPA: hypothetical protein CFH78_07615 [Sulfurimonas sp. UBA10385]
MAQVQSYDIPLHDIKPIVEIEEYSFYYFLGISSIALILVSVVIYFLYMWFKKRKTFNIRKEHFKLLDLLNLNNAKDSAYAITLYGSTFKDDSPRHKEMYENLVSRLEAYKYKKSVEKFDNETIGYIELYKGMIDV